MPKVTFMPSGREIEAKVGESILDIALANDISIQHACGGFCACTTCHCEVLAGSSNLEVADNDEIERLEVMEERTEKSRLGCQAKVIGDVTVRVINAD